MTYTIRVKLEDLKKARDFAKSELVRAKQKREIAKEHLENTEANFRRAKKYFNESVREHKRLIAQYEILDNRVRSFATRLRNHVKKHAFKFIEEGRA